KKYSTDTTTKNDGGKLSAFDNTNTSYSSKFLTAAFKLKNGEYTTSAVKTSNGYEIIRMIKNPGKGKMSDHTADLKKQIWAVMAIEALKKRGCQEKNMKFACLVAAPEGVKAVQEAFPDVDIYTAGLDER
ncbi:peptidylprolyl isomerase, partial [Klebsiella pneumoniae]|nr:peptidylprolyl isomerase [Klebsiella pneumoniae]